jgi:hypothetical protein
MSDTIIIGLLTIAITIGIVLVAMSFPLFGFGVITGAQAGMLTLAGVALVGVVLQGA